MNSLFLLAVLAVIVWLWYDALRYREFTIQQCRKICNEMEFQLLDQTVALASLSLRRDPDNRLRLLRRYNFEISPDGTGRNNGYIVISGYRIVHIEFDLPDGPVILHGKNPVSYH